MAIKVVIYCSSMRNPFVDAWARTWQATGAQVAVLARSHPAEGGDVPSWLQDMTTYLAPETSFLSADERSSIEQALGGEPDVLFYWWGVHALSDQLPRQTWPTAKTLLCVDTFPNAARLATELRELFRAQYLLQRADGLVVTSNEMLSMMRKTVPALRRKPYAVVTSPFPLAAHAGEDIPASEGPAKFCFTGRSDFIFQSGWRMAKDDVSGILSSFIREGAGVSVQRPRSDEQRHRLEREGFSFYSDVTREGLLDGTFSRQIAPFTGHLAIYNVWNSTIRRRVATGLSTRFALAVCSPSPVIVPRESEFATQLFSQYGTGSSLGGRVADVISGIEDSQVAMREDWKLNHTRWAGESYATALLALAES